MFFIGFVCVLSQERQRLETILNLCAEYNKGEGTGSDSLGSGKTAFPGGLTDGSGRRPSRENVLGVTASPATLRLSQRQRESDEENLKEECSSTESTHQEVRTSPAPSTASALHNRDRQVRGNASFLPKRLHATVESQYTVNKKCVKVSSGSQSGAQGSLSWFTHISVMSPNTV